jgi:hypothetical protein
MEAPVAVSPGAAGGPATVSGSCPTFHWSEVDGAGAYELVLFRLGPDGQRTTELYRVELPGRTQGWTPTLERCLEPGTRYAWALRAVGRRGEVGPWSQARIFEIAGAPTIAEVEQALSVLNRWLDRGEGEAPAADATVAEGERAPRPMPPAAPGRGARVAETAARAHADVGSPKPHRPLDPHDRPLPQEPATAPTLGDASLSIEGQFHLEEESHFFKHEEVLLWEDEAAGITALGHGALGANTAGVNNTAFGTLAMHENDSGSNNTALGASAMHENVAGADNTAVGHEALGTNASGSTNTAVGSTAMHENVDGSDNTAVGVEALGSNVSGSNNTAIGSDALHLNTASNNVAVGFEALGENTTGTNNTAVGTLAMHEASIGINNTAMGFETLGTNSEGNRNAAFGHTAMHDNVSGSQNSVLGTRALLENVSGSDNTAAGYEALHVNSTGSSNVAVGIEALGGNTTGARNTAVGAETGHNSTTGSDNIYLGSGATGAAAEGNTIRIGGTTVGTAAGQQNRTFVNGIRGVTVPNAVAVLINSNTGQLGTVSSSRRYKEDIRDLDGTSDRLLELRPVSFHYKDVQPEATGERVTEYGLIAEEVAKTFPELVVYDEEGRPQTVKYHLLSTLLLNELQELEARNRELEERMRDQEENLDRLKAKVAKHR